METKLLTADEQSIMLAADLIRRGEVVAVPTETVYGLAGDATNGSAIKKIFEAKGRPQDNPLIVHISNFQMLHGVVSEFDERAQKLANAFWPGPLTMILPKGDAIASEVTAGLSSVGVRMPLNEVARAIIEVSGVPFAAPSANLSGKPSPTTAEDVFDDMNGRIPLIINGGASLAGVESTVVSMLGDVPVILRPGVITKEDLESVLGTPVEIASAVTQELKANETALSPGMKYKHYAPKAEVIILQGSLEKFKKYVSANKKNSTFVLCFDEEVDEFDVPTLAYGSKFDPAEQASKLFAALRMLDKANAELVYARCPEKSGVSLAVFNRLIRSAGFHIIDLDK